MEIKLVEKKEVFSNSENTRNMNMGNTNYDIRQATFIEGLSASLRRAAKAVNDNKKFIALAKSYKEDGLDESECIELLMIDGLPREAAESCLVVAENDLEQMENGDEYSFQFEDTKGRVWSSFDINRTITASSEEEAFAKAEDSFSEPEDEDVRVLSVSRI